MICRCDWNKLRLLNVIKPVLLLCLFLTCLLSVSDEETSRSKASSKKVSFNLPEQEEEEDSEGEDIGDILGGKSQSKISETKSSFEKRQEKVNSKDLRSYLNYQLMWIIMNIGQFVLPEDSWNQSQFHAHYGLLVWSNPVADVEEDWGAGEFSSGRKALAVVRRGDGTGSPRKQPAGGRCGVWTDVQNGYVSRLNLSMMRSSVCGS